MENQGERVRKLKVWRDCSVGLTEGVDRDYSPRAREELRSGG